MVYQSLRASKRTSHRWLAFGSICTLIELFIDCRARGILLHHKPVCSYCFPSLQRRGFSELRSVVQGHTADGGRARVKPCPLVSTLRLSSLPPAPAPVAEPQPSSWPGPPVSGGRGRRGSCQCGESSGVLYGPLPDAFVCPTP